MQDLSTVFRRYTFFPAQSNAVHKGWWIKDQRVRSSLQQAWCSQNALFGGYHKFCDLTWRGTINQYSFVALLQSNETWLVCPLLQKPHSVYFGVKLTIGFVNSDTNQIKKENEQLVCPPGSQQFTNTQSTTIATACTRSPQFAEMPRA